MLNYLESKVLEPHMEIGAYEALWQKKGMWFKDIAKMFSDGEQYPSHFIDENEALTCFKQVEERVKKARLSRFGMQIRGTYDYPNNLLDATEPVELLYYDGNWDLIFSKSIAIVGTRKPSDEGVRRTNKITDFLVENGFTIVSGLAEGIDTAAHETALNAKGRTIAVIGTPLDQIYPRSNAELMRRIAKDHLVISQVPFLRYNNQTFRENRFFFPERNKTMSAITKATVIIEAGETSGTLVQARAALKQGRKLFILQSCFENKNITWPEKFEKLGAIRIQKFDDILNNLGTHDDKSSKEN